MFTNLILCAFFVISKKNYSKKFWKRSKFDDVEIVKQNLTKTLMNILKNGFKISSKIMD